MVTDVTAVLRQTYLLRAVPAGEVEAMAAVSRLRAFRRGQVVFTAGDPGGALMVVVSGRVKVVVRSADGGELTLTIIEPGGVLGEVSLADGGPRSADAEALEERQLLLVPREAVGDICTRVPSVAQGRRWPPSQGPCGGLPREHLTLFSWICRAGSRRYCSASPGTTAASSSSRSARNSSPTRPEAHGKASTPRCAVLKGEAGSKCVIGRWLSTRPKRCAGSPALRQVSAS